MKCYPFFGRLVSSFNVMLLHSNISVSISLDVNTMKVSIVWCALLGNQFLLEGGLKISSFACFLFASFDPKCAESSIPL